MIFNRVFQSKSQHTISCLDFGICSANVTQTSCVSISIIVITPNRNSEVLHMIQFLFLNFAELSQKQFFITGA